MNSWLVEVDEDNRISPVVAGITIAKYPAKILGLTIVPTTTFPVMNWYIPVIERNVPTNNTKRIKFCLSFFSTIVVTK
ncbi:unnamed protein product [marine sediment metagenome]|uniref:Uncharacterized protein n=1 Tax=marine sediment metagenome TaxID=412755 RepID=X1M3I2_9ZZZZ